MRISLHKRRGPGSALYNTGPIESLASKNWNMRQFYDVSRVDYKGKRNGSTPKPKQLGRKLPCPPCNIGPRSTPNYGPWPRPSPLGLLGGDLAGFPNGRRVADDVVNVELQAIAGLTYPLVDKTYTPDAAASAVTQGLTPGPDRYQATFPYLGTPLDGYNTPSA